MNGNAWKLLTGILFGGLLSLNGYFWYDAGEKLTQVDGKIFDHMTNDDLHVPREYVVSRAEFELYKLFHRDNMEEIRSSLRRIEKKVDSGRSNTGG